MWKGIFRYGSMLMVFWALVLHASAQKRKSYFVPFQQAWKVEVRGGTGLMLTEVPDEHLGILNDVNVPVHDPGLYTTFSLRKAITGHIEMGYQLSYVNLSGDVEQQLDIYRVRTQGLEHSGVILVNLKRTDTFRPRLNYFAYYKFGVISLKNEVSLRMPDGSLYTDPAMQVYDSFLNNAAVGTGVGVGMNYRFTNHMTFVGACELNRSSDTGYDIFKIHKVFYPSPNTVNHYSSLTFGVSYTFDLEASKKTSSYYKPRSRISKRLTHARIKRKNRRR